MNTEEDNCPICLLTKTDCYTECGHSYCINCLSKIKNCAICRKNLIRVILFNELKQKYFYTSRFSSQEQEPNNIVASGWNFSALYPDTYNSFYYSN
jgi:hypothetical protein